MKKFCDKCLKEVECTYNEKYIDISIDNNKINYLKKYYICSECNNEFLDDLYDYDVEIVNKKLRELNNIITIDEIEEIIRKYNIGKKPLSLLNFKTISLISSSDMLLSFENQKLAKNLSPSTSKTSYIP